MDSCRADLLPFAAHWNLVLEPHVIFTPQAVIAFGHQDDLPIVVKVVNSESDTLQSAAALSHYGGYGVVHCIDQFGNALLLERIIPGKSLTESVLSGDDDRAMQILCSVIRKLQAAKDATSGYPTVEGWGASFANYRERPQHPALSLTLAVQAEAMYTALCCSQKRRVFLHGDLHHDNVLFGANRGWVAIDPKGVIGEPEYEMGAALRNPTQHVTYYADTAIIRRRVAVAADELGFDRMRMLDWCFSQAILSSIWAIEDGDSDFAISRGVAVAKATLPLL